MASGEGGEAEWSKALKESEGTAPGAFEAEMKMKGLMGFSAGGDPKIAANSKLLSWLEENGDVYLADASTWGVAPHPMAISVSTVDETTNESTGRGLLARRNINEGDELLTIPMSMCVTIESARKTFGEEVITNGMNEYLAIALQLVHERYVLGDDSFYKAYLDVLPEVEEVNPTFAWPDDDLEFLEGSPVLPATKSLQMKLKREWEALVANDVDGLSTRFPDRFPLEKFSYENWVWAFTMLFSRAIRLRNLREGEALAMVPYADLINHSPFSGAYVDAREVGDWLFKDGTEEVILYADRGYRKMEQIYISYGPKSNADLLLLYGFALERNPYNSVDVTVSIKPRVATGNNPENDADADPLAEEKIAFLQNVGREDTVDFPCYADRYPIEMLEYLRLMQMTPEDTRGKPLSAFDFSRTISAANEAAVLTSIIQAIKMQLNKYPNSEEDDARLIQDKGMFRLFNYNQRMAIRHRRNEKRLLKRTVAALDRQIKTRGLDREDLQRAMGSTLGIVLPGEERFGKKGRTAIEERLEKMGLPVDLR
eukprot:CAMPEP_0172493918 /NCGR_PEP_ID=MMETSP1066-20121228/32794_1 /TAXON_ID=671091 /ORGANISM="Coscinodiscus wailesii, Strain CCMP2513" /LENGTH=540 /DNA_ID=CAMNT_0013264391 /DNA_START=197 /DNA_END=1819 /DNA_ORIENTATION=-